MRVLSAVSPPTGLVFIECRYTGVTLAGSLHPCLFADAPNGASWCTAKVMRWMGTLGKGGKNGKNVKERGGGEGCDGSRSIGETGAVQTVWGWC